MKKLTLALTAFGLMATQASAEFKGNIYAGWVQYTGDGTAQARVVIDTDPANPAGTKCPDIRHGNTKTPMTLRSGFAPLGFEGVRVCVAPVDSTMVGMFVPPALRLPTPSTDPQKIAVLGDTGCRVAYGIVQNCAGDGQGKAWDYEAVADRAAQDAPDLFIHVGDMHYRETGTCDEGCHQSNIGYSWASWKADFFDPSATVFQTAPLIPVRGNHEDCTRAWKGWFYLLDPNPIETTSWPASCPGKNGAPLDAGGNDWSYTLPYPVPFDSFQVIVMDTARIDNDYGSRPDQGAVDQYKVEFSSIELIAEQAAVPSWLVTHRPFWAIASYGSEAAPKASPTDQTLQVALAQSVQKALPSQIKLTMAGHIHLAQQLSFSDGRPSQFVFGNSGTKRDPELGTGGVLHSNAKRALGRLGANINDFFWSYHFSYGLITPGSGVWDVSFHDAAGQKMHSTSVAQ
ncbi:metallophosphoesterase [Ascidiaceihabitans sp.]|uniref:metallophosphoesterase family protein n=1 Tax=Ascidiaceihabitans sp. TaxID=1872644 RepID=UPI00329A4795